MLPSKLLERYDRETVTALGMVFAAVTLNLLCRSWRYDVQLPLRGWLAVAAIVVLGSVVSFSLIMQSIVDIGPSKSSMLASSEPLSATVFSVLWLGTSFSGTDLIGFAAHHQHHFPADPSGQKYCLSTFPPECDRVTGSHRRVCDRNCKAG